MRCAVAALLAVSALSYRVPGCFDALPHIITIPGHKLAVVSSMPLLML